MMLGLQQSVLRMQLPLLKQYIEERFEERLQQAQGHMAALHGTGVALFLKGCLDVLDAPLQPNSSCQLLSPMRLKRL